MASPVVGAVRGVHAAADDAGRWDVVEDTSYGGFGGEKGGFCLFVILLELLWMVKHGMYE